MDAGRVPARPAGARRVYHIDPKGLGAMRAWLDQFWDVALQAYAAEVEHPEKE